MAFIVFAKVGKGRLSLKDFKIRKALSAVVSLLYKTNRFHVAVRLFSNIFILFILFIIDHRRRQNVVRTSVTHSAIASCATFLSLPHFDVICDLILNRRTAT